MLHAKARSIYENYMIKYRPVLLRNLGPLARWEPEFKDEVHGEGASRCKTLFPGFWPPSRSCAFTAMYVQVLGAKERKVRKLMIKQFTPERLLEFNVDPVAVAQQFHHSMVVENKNYKNGLRNTVTSNL